MEFKTIYFIRGEQIILTTKYRAAAILVTSNERFKCRATLIIYPSSVQSVRRLFRLVLTRSPFRDNLRCSCYQVILITKWSQGMLVAWFYACCKLGQISFVVDTALLFVFWPVANSSLVINYEYIITWVSYNKMHFALWIIINKLQFSCLSENIWAMVEFYVSIISSTY